MLWGLIISTPKFGGINSHSKHWKMKKLIAILSFFAGSVLLSSCLKENTNYNDATPSPFIIIEDVRALYKGTDVLLSGDNLMGGSKITGIVTSDIAAGNVRAGTVVIQQTKRDFTRGIVLDLGAAAAVPFLTGDSLVVDIIGALLTNYKGSLQIGKLTPDKIVKAGSGKSIIPTVVTLTDLNANFKQLESVLIQVVGVDVDPVPSATDTYSGNKNIKDVANATLVLHTEPTASFANNSLPVNATFTGIAAYFNATANTNTDAARQIWIRNAMDVTNASGSLYANWPENFENPNPFKNTYAAGNIVFRTGTWRFDNAVVNLEANDRPVSPVYAVRMQQNLSVSSYIQMMFDVNNGASKVSVWHSSYGASADPPATWRLEYSTDGGTSWAQTGADVKSVSKTKQLATFIMDIPGKVRFRINKLGLGSNAVDPTIENGRLSLDDFSIYRKP
jgi:hypothetical protein